MGLKKNLQENKVRAHLLREYVILVTFASDEGFEKCTVHLEQSHSDVEHASKLTHYRRLLIEPPSSYVTSIPYAPPYICCALTSLHIILKWWSTISLQLLLLFKVYMSGYMSHLVIVRFIAKIIISHNSHEIQKKYGLCQKYNIKTNFKTKARYAIIPLRIGNCTEGLSLVVGNSTGAVCVEWVH